MADIPYYFEHPVPRYFRDNGWFENENAFKFITWSFAKCSNEPHKIVLQGKEIILEPYEFVAGRLTSSKECYLSEKQFRGIAERMQAEGILKKTANSKANQYTCYIWVTARFCKSEGQQKGQRRANEGPTKGHKQEYSSVSLEEQQQESAVAVFSCLENINDPSIAKEDKVNITQKYKDQEQVVIDAVAVVTAADFVPDITLLKSLYAACKGAWKPKESKTQWLAINKAKALELEKKGHEFYTILTGSNYLEIVMGMVSKLVQFEQHPEKFDKEIKFHLKQELKNNA